MTELQGEYGGDDVETTAAYDEEQERLRYADCLDFDGPDASCSGAVEYRMALSGTGRSFPRCDKHWEKRLETQQDIGRRYPYLQPTDFDPYDAGERWDEEY